MPSLSPYSPALDYSYAPGVFPSMECLKHRPDAVRRLLLHSSSAGRDGADKLRDLARISGKENCFAAAVFAKFEDALDPAKPHVVLHHPGDSGNVGTILRTALGFGVEDVALIRPCVDLFDPKTVRASMGSLFSLRVRLYDSFESYLESFPAHALYPFMLDASRPLHEVLQAKPAAPWTLIFGNEGSGLPPEFASCGQPVRIESNDRIDSLNLAIAAGIAIYEFSRF